MKAIFAIALLAVSILCASTTLAQEDTEGYWLNIGYELLGNDSFEEAAEAFDKAIEINPENASAWIARGDATRFFLGRRNESLQSYEKALEILNETLEKNPQDASGCPEA